MVPRTKSVEEKQVSRRRRLTPFEQAMKELGLTRPDILNHEEYPDRFVLVTVTGRKLVWPKRES